MAHHISSIHRSSKINCLQFVGPPNCGKSAVLEAFADFCLLWTNPRNFSGKFGKQAIIGKARLAYFDEIKFEDIKKAVEDFLMAFAGQLAEAERKFTISLRGKFPPAQKIP